MSVTSKTVVIALVAALYLAVPWRWARATEARDRHAAQVANSARAAIDARIVHARSVLRDKPGWAAKVAAVTSAYPPSIDVAGALSRLRTTADQAGAQLVSISASPAAPSTSGITPIQIELRLTGPVAAIEGFLIALRSVPRLVTTTAASMTSTGAATTIHLTAQLWILPGAVPVP